MAEIDRRADREKRDRIDELREEFFELARQNRQRIDDFATRTGYILLAIVAINLVLGVMSIYLLDQNSNRANEIQTERAASVRYQCDQQNLRHDKTIAKLAVIVAEIPDPVEKARAQRNLAGTTALIDALAPKQTCNVLVRRLVGAQSSSIKTIP